MGAAALLVPDISLAGYLGGPKVGAAIYNSAHWYGGPLLVWLLVPAVPIAVPLIWAAHIGMDRMVGYGLKYPADFHDTHLGRLGVRDAAGA
jgi:hypothetical protein